MAFHFGNVKIMKRFRVCFMFLLMTSVCDASRLNMRTHKLAKKILSGSNKKPLKSIESPDGDIIDCVLASHQPAFDHPLLKNHTIQMMPNHYPERLLGENTKKSNFVPHSKDDFTKPIPQLWHLNGRCPEGTVPIRRTKHEDIMRASSINSFRKKQKRFSQLPTAAAAVDFSNHEHSFAAVGGNQYYGAQATISVWNPKVQNQNEFSLSQIWILGGPNTNLNTIEAGWTVDPLIYRDYNTRLFVYWTSDGYQSTGCYNLMCSGFVQTNNNLAMGASISSQSEITILIWKDPQQNVWWLKYGTETVGYWPTSLFQYLTDSASVIEWGGEVINNRVDGQHTTTQMGSGHFAEEGAGKASYFKNLQVVDGSNTLRPPGVIRVFAEQPSCYNILPGKSTDSGDYFYYGGPGRNPKCP